MNYSDITTAAFEYTDRSDTEVVARVDTFIKMVESKMNRQLKVRQQSVRIYAPIILDRRFYTLPPDFAGMRDIQKNSTRPNNEPSTCPMVQLTPEQMNVKRNEVFNGTLYYSVEGRELQIYPTGSAGETLELLYFQRVPPITNGDADEGEEDSTFNWMSTENPDAYISGISAEIELFAKNYDAGRAWYDRMASIINELETASVEETWSGAPLSTRVE